MPETLSRTRRLAYAAGYPGFQLSERVVVSIAIYYYLPPPGRGLLPQVSNELLWGLLTVFGLAMLLGRVVDSVTDPIVAHWSDRSRSRWGRRRSFMMLGVLPMVALPLLLFWPPGGSDANASWLLALLVLYFFFYTLYVAPYLALIPELARSEGDRVKLVSWMSIGAFPVIVVFGGAWTVGFEALQGYGLDPPAALRSVVGLASIGALLLCLGPILAVDERRFTVGRPSDLSLGQAIRATLANRPFCIYLGAQLLFVMSLNLVQPAMPYLATVVLGRGEAYTGLLMLASLPGVAVGFAIVHPMVRRFGAKRSMIASLALWGLSAAALGLLRPGAPGAPWDLANQVIALTCVGLSGLPVVGFLVVPHVLLAQLVDYDATRTGAERAAMYYGMQGFLTKWMYGAAAWVLTFLFSRFGNSTDQPLGVLLVGPVAGGACLLAIAFYAFYPEKRLLSAVANSRSGSGDVS